MLCDIFDKISPMMELFSCQSLWTVFKIGQKWLKFELKIAGSCLTIVKKISCGLKLKFKCYVAGCCFHILMS